MFSGLVMVPAKVLVYYQMAQFLMLVMVVSWFCSTFFFLPLCMAIGPTKNFGQLTCKKIKVAKETVRKMSTKNRPEHHVSLGNVNPEDIHTHKSIENDDCAVYNNKTDRNDGKTNIENNNTDNSNGYTNTAYDNDYNNSDDNSKMNNNNDNNDYEYTFIQQ